MAATEVQARDGRIELQLVVRVPRATAGSGAAAEGPRESWHTYALRGQ